MAFNKPNESDARIGSAQIFDNKPKVTASTTTTTPMTPQAAANNKSTMWDELSTTVDINLDNLSRYSKGSKNSNANLPMNMMMTPSSKTPVSINTQRASFGSPLGPLSPNAVVTNKPAQATPLSPQSPQSLLSPTSPNNSAGAGSGNTSNLLDF